MAKKGIKSLVAQIIVGANAATALGMFLTGYSYLVDPEQVAIVSTWGLVFPFFLLVNALFLVFWLFFLPRKVWIPFLAFIICYFPVRMYMGINIPDEVGGDAIKVMSYNVLGFRGMPGEELERDTNMLVEYLCEEDCDIVCLQESGESWLSEGCRARLERVYPYHQIDECQAGGNFISIYSKHKILRSETIPYESAGNLSMAYTVQMGDDEVTVINNHLESNNLTLDERAKFHEMVKGNMQKDSAKIESLGLMAKLTERALKRTPQTKAVAKYITEHKGQKILLFGDFNDTPLSYCHYVIAENLTDCFVSSGVGFGWTFCHDGMRVRIDNIMCSKDFIPVKCCVDKYRYSDHYPLKCWLKRGN